LDCIDVTSKIKLLLDPVQAPLGLVEGRVDLPDV
jgi:hypothetical protein